MYNRPDTRRRQVRSRMGHEILSAATRAEGEALFAELFVAVRRNSYSLVTANFVREVFSDSRNLRDGKFIRELGAFFRERFTRFGIPPSRYENDLAAIEGAVSRQSISIVRLVPDLAKCFANAVHARKGHVADWNDITFRQQHVPLIRTLLYHAAENQRKAIGEGAVGVVRVGDEARHLVNLIGVLSAGRAVADPVAHTTAAQRAAVVELADALRRSPTTSPSSLVGNFNVYCPSHLAFVLRQAGTSLLPPSEVEKIKRVVNSFFNAREVQTKQQ